MKKSEIKYALELLVDSIEKVLDNLEDVFEPYEKVKESIESIQEVEREDGVETGIDFEIVLGDTLRSCILNNTDFEQIDTQFSDFISELENWIEEVNEKKQDQIREKYLDIVCDIKDQFDIDSVEEVVDLENQLNDMVNSLKDIEV